MDYQADPTFRTKRVITRKPHACDQCNRKFPAGSDMLVQTFLNSLDPGWVTWHICPVCEEVLDKTDCTDYDGAIWEMAAYNHDTDFWEKTRSIMEGDLHGPQDLHP
jgi:hypothetical protein